MVSRLALGLFEGTNGHNATMRAPIDDLINWGSRSNGTASVHYQGLTLAEAHQAGELHEAKKTERLISYVAQHHMCAFPPPLKVHRACSERVSRLTLFTATPASQTSTKAAAIPQAAGLPR